MKKKLTERQAMAVEFAEALAENEEHMGEGAAYLVTCEQFGIDEMDGYDLLMDHPGAVSREAEAKE